MGRSRPAGGTLRSASARSVRHPWRRSAARARAARSTPAQTCCVSITLLSSPQNLGARAATGLFATAFAVRLLHVWQMRATPFFSVLMGDSRRYDEWARRIAAGEWIGHEVFYQAPLYPYLLGL